ncbi:WhiB family transcriptional regulator [Streptomyces sp. bgisy034]|uniref:WhiB family transcriptional regulator n=1 Tax=Streptomyces sp. bgisy034 TaxID=3413774 RepID=UPI003EBA2E31
MNTGTAHWQTFAACADSTHRHLFEVKNPASEARAVCKSCPVRVECLHDALISDAPGGMWGGMGRKERRALPTLPTGKAEAIAALRELIGPAVTAKPAAPAVPPRQPATTPHEEPRVKPVRKTKAAAPKPKPKAKPKATATPKAKAPVRPVSPREDVAEMLRAGATQRQITEKLDVSTTVIAATRKAYAIPYQKGPGFRYTPEQRAEKDRRVAEMLRAGASYSEITAETGVGAPTISTIRKREGLPTAKGRNGQPARSKAEAIAANVEPYGEGHARWTGPMTGRMPQLSAEGDRFNARHEVFAAHHGRRPVGYVRTSCAEDGCIAGAHLVDDTLRDTPSEEEPVTVQALQDLLTEIDHQGGPQAARDNRLNLSEPEPSMPATDNTSHPSHIAQGTANALPLTSLLKWGDAHPDPDVQDQAARARATVQGLRARYAADRELTAITTEAEQLEKKLAELRAREAELAPKKKSKRKPSSYVRDYDPRTVRAWAAEAGVDCPGVGQIPKRVLDAWRAANTTTSADA